MILAADWSGLPSKLQQSVLWTAAPMTAAVQCNSLTKYQSICYYNHIICSIRQTGDRGGRWSDKKTVDMQLILIIEHK